MYYEYVDYMESLTTIAEYDSVRCVETPNVISTTWGQTGGYNQSYPPVGSKEHAYAGCTPVAAGQIMYCYRHPSIYNWDAMLLNQGAKATSDMLYAITAPSNPSYSEGGTGVWLADMPRTLINNGYNAVHKAAFAESSITLPCIIHNNMFSKSQNKVVGHSWIISGKKEYTYQHRFEMWTYTGYEKIGMAYLETGTPTFKRYYYVNWGWDGYNNGWFGDIATVCPNSNYSSSTMQQMIVNIYPK